MAGPEILIPLGGMTMILGIVIGTPIARAYARRMDAGPAQSALNSGEIVTRLDRIEQAVEAMATEIERISEGQRFTTRLLSESRQQPTQQPAQQPAQQIAAPATPFTPAIPAVPAEASVAERLPDGTVLSPAARRG